jgi:hypothetical protein
MSGYRACLVCGVSLTAPLRAVLIVLPLMTTATRLHAHIFDAPDLATQEVNRCLKLVHIAASRRASDRRGDEGVRPPRVHASGRRV